MIDDKEKDDDFRSQDEIVISNITDAVYNDDGTAIEAHNDPFLERNQ